MHRRSLVALTLVLFGACVFDWDAHDPRLSSSVGAGGSAAETGGAGGADGGAAGAGAAGATGGGGTGGAACDGVCEPDRCTDVLSETFSTMSSRWTYNGDAFHDVAAGAVVLTEASKQQAGTVFFNDTLVLDDLTATFEARFDSDAGAGGAGGTPTYGPADGLAFVAQTDGPTALGVDGGGLGVAGLTGWGAELDIFPNTDLCGDPAFEHVALIDLSVCGAISDQAPTTIEASDALTTDLVDTGWRAVTVEIQSGMATLRIDGAVAVGPTLIPSFVPGTAYTIGFGAGTGGGVARQSVRNVSITFPEPRCL